MIDGATGAVETDGNGDRRRSRRIDRADHIRADPDALARLMILTGFSHDFLSGLGDLDAIVRDMVDGSNWDGIARQAELDLRVDISEDLRLVKAPTLVLGNRYDQMVDPAASATIADAIEGADLRWIEGPHLALMEQPSVIGALINDYLNA